MAVELGIIEGYYGRPWSWSDREETITFLAPHGFRFFLYAPKADPYLRRLWREPHTAELTAALRRLGDRCRAEGVRFGIGLSPTRVHLQFDAEAQRVLATKLALFDELGIDDLALLFDDIKSGTADMAARQADIIHWAAERTQATRVLACPSYYTDDPVLDRVFGARPPGYVEQLGELLDPAIALFWTGEEVCAREFTPGHLRRVHRQLGRAPVLWDNYPVNDGERMSRHLHLRGFTGRPAAIGDHVLAHGINPALQPVLTRIPALTLAESYRVGDAYEYGAAFLAAAREVLGEELGTMVWQDVLQLQDFGLDQLGEKAAPLRARYAAFDHPGAREIVDWLDGGYRITDAIIHEQAGES